MNKSTAELHAERRGVAAEEWLRLLVDSVKDYAIFMLDPGGNVATWNAGAERIKGYTANEIIGVHFSAFYPAEDIRAGKCEMELEGAERDGRYEDEGWRVRKNGSQFWANVVISAVRDHTGKLVGFSKVTRDLTERRRAEQDRAARLVAEQASTVKDAFLAMLGHELRNPLAPIVTALQLIKLRGDTRSAKEHEVIDRQVRHMIRLVDDLLDVSRITRGMIEIRTKHVDIRDSIASAIEIAGPLFEQKRQDFTIDVPQRPVVVDGDDARLTQVFSNLLTNASKYTESGGHIRLKLRHVDADVSVEVTDDGLGIDAGMLPQVFDLFVQGPQTSERSVGGLGLGLTLVRALVQLHGGSVNAHSDGLGRGSTFTVHLPAVERPATHDTIDRLATVLSGETPARRILIVDDNEDARLLLCEILTTLGHDVRTSPDGFGALELVSTWKPDAAILDIGLPIMDGYELAAKLQTVLGPSTRLVALTGYGQPTDQERTRAAGFARHLVKPVDMRRLIDSIAPEV